MSVASCVEKCRSVVANSFSAPRVTRGFIAALVLLCMAVPLQAASFQSVTTGQWNVGSTWDQSGAIPGSGDTVTILDGHTVTVSVPSSAAAVSFQGASIAPQLAITSTGSLSITGDLTLSDNGSVDAIVNVGDGILTVGGSIALQEGANGGVARLQIGAGTATCGAITSTATQIADARIEFSGAGLLNVAGAMAANLTLVNHTGGIGSTVRFNGTVAQTVPGLVFQNLALANTNGSGASAPNAIGVNGSLKIENGMFSLTNSLTTSGSSTLTMAAATTFNAGTAFSSFNVAVPNFASTTLDATSKIVYGANANQTINPGIPYQNLTVSFTGSAGNPTKAFSAATSVAGNLVVDQTLPGTVTLDINGVTVNVTGSVSGDGAIAFTGGGDLQIGAGFNNHLGTFTAGTGTVTYTGGGSSSGRHGISYYDLVFAQAGSRLFGGSFAVTNDLTINNGAYVYMGAGNTLTVGGNVAVYQALNDAGTLVMNGAGKTLEGTGSIAPAVNVNGNTTIVAGSNLTVAGNITIAASVTLMNGGILDANASILGSGTFVNGSTGQLWVFTNVNATLDASAAGNSVTYDGDGFQPIQTVSPNSGAQTIYHHLLLDATFSSTTKTTTGPSPLVVNGDLSLFPGLPAVTFESGTAATIGGGVTIGSGATFNANSHSYTVGGNWSASGIFNPGTSTVTFDGLAAQSIGPTTFSTVRFDNSTKTAGGAIGALANFEITSDAVVNGGTFSHTVAGNWVQASTGVFNPGTSTVTFNGAANQTLDATTFHNLIIANTAGTASLNGNVSVAGALDVNDGIFDVGSSSLDVNGNLVVASAGALDVNVGTVSLAGSVQTDGPMSAITGTVTVDGTAIQNWTGTTAPTLHNLDVNNATGSLNPAVTINLNGFLTLTNGVVVTSGTAAINVQSGGSVSRTNGWIDGRLNQNHSAGGVKVYPFGTTAGYAPATITIGAGGQLDLEIFDGTHPNATGANLLGCYWTIHPTSNVAGPVDLQFQYQDPDVVGTETSYIPARYQASVWSQPAGSVTAASNTIAVPTVSSYPGAWTAGEAASIGGVVFFEVSSADNAAVAGTTDTLTITAKDSSSATVTGYSGSQTLIFSGASTAPDGTLPRAIDNTTMEIDFGSNTNVTFTNGVATVDVRLFAAETATISVTQSTVTGSESVTVDADAASELALLSLNGGSPVYQNAPFDLDLGVTDSWGNPALVSANTDVTLSVATGTGTLGGTLTSAIPSGSGSVLFQNLTYDVAEAMSIAATDTSASPTLTSSTIPATFAAQLAGIVVTTSADSGAGSLREAFTRINNGECGTPCNVTFNIAPSGPHTITLLSLLPDLTLPAVLDAATQPGYAGTPLIRVEAPGLSEIMLLANLGSTVRGFAFGNATGEAVLVYGNNIVIEDCWIGLDASGTSASATSHGIVVKGNNNTIRNNVVSGNGTGIELSATATNNIVRSNLVGTDVTGTSSVPNNTGVHLLGSATSNTIGGSSPSDRNVISGNSGNGVNLVGTLILIDSVSPGTFGGVASNAGGLVELNVLENNLIGVEIDGTSPLGNGTGVHIGTATSANIIRNNTIANNTTAGIAAPNGTANVFTTNSIYDNGALGIDLINDGVTANDVDDVDTGSNGRQNFPVLSSATLDSFGNVTVAYSMDGPTTAGSIRVEFFKADTLASGEGMTYLSSQCTAGNDFAIGATFPAGGLVAGNGIVATATSHSDASCGTVLDGTSEFSAAATVAACTTPTPTITASGPTTFCAGGSVILTASAADSWLWSNGATTQSITVTTAGSYTVTATTSGCSATSAATTVTVNPAPAAVITASGATTFCDGGSVTLTASNGDSWLWSNGATTQSITVTTGGSYTVDVTTTGCTTTSSPTNVTVNPLPTVSITGPSSMCPGGTVVLDAGTGFASYLWSTGATTQTISVSPAATTTYSVSVTDGNGCSNSATHTVAVAAALTPVITGPSSMCEGASVTLDAGTGYVSYLWSNGATTQTISVSPASTTTYNVTVSDGTCSGNTSHTVTVTPAPVATITPGGPTTFCDGGSVTLTASNGDSWLWSNGATTQSITVSTAGSYTVQVTSSGCSATSSSVPVTVTPNPVATITAGGPTAICDGDSVTLTASAGDSWLWSTGATTQSIAVSTAGSYSVTVTSGSCSDASPATTVTVNPAPTATIAAPTTICANSTGNAASVTPQAGATYAWTIANGTITSGDGTPTIEFKAGGSGTLSLNVTVSVGSCSASDSAAVSLSPAPVANIAAPANSEPEATHSASVAAQAGTTYTWTIDNGTILSGAGTSAITFKTAAAGQTKLTVEATLGSCTATDIHFVSIAGGEPTRANLSITKTAPASVAAGSGFAYTLVAQNAGPDSASVVVRDVLPAGTTFVSTSSTLICGNFGNEITCSGSMSPGSTRHVTINVTAPQSGGAITNTATISSPVTDPVTANNSASVSTNITGAAGCPTIAPIALAPSAETVASPVTFSWTASDVATDYEVWVVTSGSAQRVGTTSATSLTVGLTPGAIEWYVVARGGNCTPLESARSSATVSQSANCGAPPIPQLTSPRNSSVSGPEVTFSWTPSPGAIGYRVWAEINNTEAQDLGTTDGSTTTLTTTLPAGSMKVYVEALFSGCPVARSASVSFRVALPDPCAERTKALPMLPANGSTLETSTVSFEWHPANEPDGYRVWIRRNGGTAEVLGTTVDETKLDLGLESGAYEWWVESLYDGCASTESDHRTFVIPQRGGCSTTAPALLEPANHTSLSNGVVTFRWTSIPNAVRYEVWLSVDRGTPSLVGSSETTSLTVEVSDGAIEWFVRAIVDRCPTVQSPAFDFSLVVPDACDANKRPVTVSPVSRSLVTAPFDCVWTAVEGATHYELFVRRGSSRPVSIGTTTATRMDDLELDNGNVRWFVRAHFASCPPRDSAEEKLQVVPDTAACGTLDVPMIAAVAQVSSGIPFLIQWTPSPGATSYQLQVADNAQFNGAETFTVHEAMHELTRTNDSGAATPIFARVRAIDGRCPRTNVSAYGLTAAIYVLPFEGSEGATPAGNGLVSHTINLGSELAGQSFVVSLKEPWLTASPMSGVVGPAGTDIVVTADTTGLPFGSSLGSVTLTLTSASAGNVATHATSIKPATISISKITPVTPTPKSTPPPDALIIPAVAHASGINAEFQSDVRVTNSSAQLINYQLTFTPSGDSGIATGRQTNFAIEAGKTVALDDVLRTWFGTGTESVTGTLEVRPLTQTASATSNAALSGLVNLVTFASSRTFNTTANGTFGQHIPAIPYANFIGGVVNGAPSKILSLQQIAQSDRYRTNLGIVEGSGEPVSLLVKVFGETGQKLVEFPLNLAGGQHTQLNSFLAQRGVTSLNDGRVEISVTSPAGKITAYASVLDNATSDPLLVSPISLSDIGTNKWVVPGVADLSSNGANWRTDMRIFNAETTDVDVTLSFHSQNGGTPKTSTMTIPAGQVRQLDGTLASVFGATNDGGAVHITTSGNARLITTARTYNQTTSGTFGQFISGVTSAEAAGVGSRPLQLLQVEETARFRTNVGIAEVSGNAVTVEVAVVPPDSKFTATTEVTLGPNEFRQLTSVLRSMGLADTYNARVTVKPVGGNGRVTAYASVIDALTNDPTYIPAQ